ncbi:GEVED domain-containing protein [Flavobacterium cerinum]|uniref:GEVED domain-containing protein n=1 Tax=Flavobacterium cerinum TaxID=2502784 RepID=A0ABY5IV84_9FLAO|nr:GEVED domain-containing protein [Flavobacterium cerinum]UUC45678.1 GEVED domain-containing protein [Flavobacterium cerinum]
MCPLNNKKSDSENNAANVLNFSDFNFRNSFVLILFLLLSNFGFAQVSNYSFSEGSTTYSAISGGTAPFSSNWDDNVSANNIGLGFTFNFNGTNYTTCSINSNGFITFGTTTSSSSEYSPISSGTGYAGAISALGVNLVNGGNGSSITYRTIGSAPNRVFVVQWTDIERSARGGDFNFQIRLTETSNVVSIVYGSCDPSNNSNVNVQVGLRGNTNNDYNNRSLSSTTNWAQSTTAGNANNATVRTRNNAYPDTNLLYTWAPAVACTAPNSQPSALTLTDITNNSINGSFTASSPAPDNYLVIANTTGTAPTINNGTNYTIGQDLGSTNIVIDNDGNTTFSATGLSANTKYYFFVYSYNSNCTGGTKYRTTSPLTGNATTLVYCTATSSSSSYYISSYRTTGAVIDAVNNNSGYSPSGYGDFTSLSAVQQIAGGDINISVVLTGPDKQNLRAWVDWNKNNNFDSGEIVYASNNKLSSTTFGFVIPTGTTPGNYRIRLRSGNVNGSSLTSCSNTSNGETEDYIITVIADCPAKIVSAPTVESCGVGPVTLTVTGSAGVTSYRWYNFESGGTPIAGATSSSYTTPSLNMTTTYYVTALNGSCESLVRRPITAKIKPVPNITITPSSPEICGDNNFVQISATGSTEVVELLNENFEGSGLGSFTKSGTGTSSVTEWQQKNSIYTTTTDNWKPAINSGTGTTGGNKFAFATADVDSTSKSIILTSTSSFNTTNFLDLTLTFRQYYSYYGNGESANIEVSKDNGVTWINVINNTSSQGAPSKFVTTIVYLNDYIGVPNLKFRFRYQAAFCDGWAIDDVVLSGTRPLTSNFTWTGATIDAYIDANGVTPYTNQAVNTVYIKPSTAQLEVSNWSFTANVLLSNGCTASKPVSVTNKSKVWQGNNGNWNDPNNWLPVGVPTSDNCVIIKPASSYSTINGTNYEAQAKTLTVRANARLEVPANNGIKVVNKIEVQNNGTLNLDNNASIVQVDNVANSGNVNIRRTTKPMYRYDFTYWNSPVTQASNFTLGMLSPNTLADKYMRWQPTINGGYGNWISVNATTAMDPRMGYIVRAPQTFDLNPSNKTPYTTTFVGTPNNGDISIPIAVGTDANVGGGVTADDDQWNLIGNPYASAIDVVSFLTDNTNKTLMDGTVYIWTHNTPISNNTPSPFYGTYAFNYTAADYATVNKFGATATAASGGSTPSRYIASGQSFFVKGLANGNARFINTMRVSNKNDNFLKNGNSTKDNPETQSVAGADSESHRIWLNLANESGAFSQILVGYDSDATMDFDRGLDGQSFGGNGVTFYSTIPNMNLTIQARPLPFNVQDQIPLGFNANAQNTYQIGIDHLDGMFDTHAIYLEDKTTNTIHDLRTAPYSFTSAAGTFDNRFVLRFNNGTLGNGDFSLENGIKVLRGGELAVNSTTERIKNITAFDVLGRKIDEYKNVNENEIVLKNVKKSSSVVLLKITLENGATVDRKTIF